MEVVYGGKLSYGPAPLTHRGPGLSFKDLFLGDDNDIANNYLFTLGRQETFHSPVHHHNFDQFRFVTEGEINILSNMNLKAGDLCYHPEGAYYGPQDDGPGVKEVLVLQFGGASGQGFVSYARLKKTQQEMGEFGSFEGGKFIPKDGGNPVDGYQATWERTMKRKLVYPQARYDRPIKMQPDSFEWKAIKGSEGAWRKNLGVFSERETRAEVIKIQSGKWVVPAEDATQLFFVWKGKGSVDGQELEEQAAGRLHPGTSASISSEGGVEILRYVVPTIHAADVNGVGSKE